MSALKMVEAPTRPQARAHLDTNTEHPTPAERAALGAQARAEVPRESHADFKVPAAGPTRSPCSRSRQRRACRNWCRSGGAG